MEKLCTNYEMFVFAIRWVGQSLAPLLARNRKIPFPITQIFFEVSRVFIIFLTDVASRIFCKTMVYIGRKWITHKLKLILLSVYLK